MAHDHTHAHSHDHTHGHAHEHHHGPDHHHGPGHHHHHAPGQPHPAQAVAWSILRMPLAGRLAVAAVLSAALWAFVLIAMR